MARRRRCHHQASTLSNHSARLASAIQRHGMAPAGAGTGAVVAGAVVAAGTAPAGDAVLPPIAGSTSMLRAGICATSWRSVSTFHQVTVVAGIVNGPGRSGTMANACSRSPTVHCPATWLRLTGLSG